MGRRDGNETLLMCMCERDKGGREGGERGRDREREGERESEGEGYRDIYI